MPSKFRIVTSGRCLGTALLLLLGGCSDGSSSAGDGAATKSGELIIGAARVPFAASRQCSVYGTTVTVWGFTAGDSAEEVTIDIGELNQIRLGDDSNLAAWTAVPETIKAEINGRKASGSARFRRMIDGRLETERGSFAVDCG